VTILLQKSLRLTSAVENSWQPTVCTQQTDSQTDKQTIMHNTYTGWSILTPCCTRSSAGAGEPCEHAVSWNRV